MLNGSRQLRRARLIFSASLLCACVIFTPTHPASAAAPSAVRARSSSDTFAKRGDRSLQVVYVQQLLIDAKIWTAKTFN